MPTNLPNTVFRPIQVEETSGKNPFSEFLTQGIGGDINFLKKSADDLQAQIAAYTASGLATTAPVALTAIFTTTGAAYVSPSGKQWAMAFVMPMLSGAPKTQFFGVNASLATNIFFNNGMTPVHASAVISGTSNEFITFGGWGGAGQQWAGFGFYEP